MRYIIATTLIFLAILTIGCSDQVNEERKIIKQEEFIIYPGELNIYDWPKVTQYFNLKITVESDYPIDVWVVPSKTDVDLINERYSDFRYFSAMSRQSVLRFSAEGYVPPTTHVVFVNWGSRPAKVNVIFEVE